MDLFFSTSNVLAYFKKQALLPHSWSGRDLHKELTPLQKACLSLQLNKVNKLLEKRNAQLRSTWNSDVTTCGAGLTPLECALKENVFVLLRKFTPDHRTYRYQINKYNTHRKAKIRRNILSSLLRSEVHKDPGWSVLCPTDIPWGIIDRDESHIILDHIELSTGQVLESIAHGWISWQKSIYYSANEAFFLNHLSPFYIRYPRCCMRYQSKLMLAGLKHGLEVPTFRTVEQLIVTLLDNALVFQAMLACYKIINGPTVRPSDFDWISQNLSSILETDFYRHRSISKALQEYMNLTLADSVKEFDNNILDNVPQQLPGYILTRFKVIARGLACMDREGNRHLPKLLISTLLVIECSLSVFRVSFDEENLEKLACCMTSALTTFRHEMKQNLETFQRLKSCTMKFIESADASLSDHLPFIIMRQAISNIPVEIQEIYIPNIFSFLFELGVDLNIRSKLNNENLLLTCISNFNFTCLLLEMLLTVKVYPFTVNKMGVCFANRVNEFFTGGYCRLDEDDLESLEFLKLDFPILQKPYPLRILAARESGKVILKFPTLANPILTHRKLIEFIKLHMTDPGLFRDS